MRSKCHSSSGQVTRNYRGPRRSPSVLFLCHQRARPDHRRHLASGSPPRPDHATPARRPAEPVDRVRLGDLDDCLTTPLPRDSREACDNGLICTRWRPTPRSVPAQRPGFEVRRAIPDGLSMVGHFGPCRVPGWFGPTAEMCTFSPEPCGVRLARQHAIGRVQTPTGGSGRAPVTGQCVDRDHTRQCRLPTLHPRSH